jgi:hypothetical protein
MEEKISSSVFKEVNTIKTRGIAHTTVAITRASQRMIFEILGVRRLGLARSCCLAPVEAEDISGSPSATI